MDPSARRVYNERISQVLNELTLASSALQEATRMLQQMRYDGVVGAIDTIIMHRSQAELFKIVTYIDGQAHLLKGLFLSSP